MSGSMTLSASEDVNVFVWEAGDLFSPPQGGIATRAARRVDDHDPDDEPPDEPLDDELDDDELDDLDDEDDEDDEYGELDEELIDLDDEYDDADEGDKPHPGHRYDE
jgi:hypothetical protein